MDFSFPVWLVLAVVNEVVVGLHEVFHFFKKRSYTVGTTLSPHVLRNTGIVTLDSFEFFKLVL